MINHQCIKVSVVVLGGEAKHVNEGVDNNLKKPKIQNVPFCNFPENYYSGEIDMYFLWVQNIHNNCTNN